MTYSGWGTCRFREQHNRFRGHWIEIFQGDAHTPLSAGQHILRLGCRHLYHAACLRPWLSLSLSTSLSPPLSRSLSHTYTHPHTHTPQSAGQHVVRLGCRHLYHAACLRPWLLRQRLAASCPTCKVLSLSVFSLASNVLILVPRVKHLVRSTCCYFWPTWPRMSTSGPH